jgi:hypothetical protein
MEQDPGIRRKIPRYFAKIWRSPAISPDVAPYLPIWSQDEQIRRKIPGYGPDISGYAAISPDVPALSPHLEPG